MMCKCVSAVCFWVLLELNVSVGMILGIPLEIAGVVLVVAVEGRHVSSCRSLFDATGILLIGAFLPGWFSRAVKDGGL